MDLPSTRPGPVICLAGNHEAMLLDALDDPDRSAARWLRHGGLQTRTVPNTPSADFQNANFLKAFFMEGICDRSNPNA